MDIKVNSTVERINSGRENGHIGIVVELAKIDPRARVLWGHSNIRTWVNFKFLKVVTQ